MGQQNEADCERRCRERVIEILAGRKEMLVKENENEHRIENHIEPREPRRPSSEFCENQCCDRQGAVDNDDVLIDDSAVLRASEAEIHDQYREGHEAQPRRSALAMPAALPGVQRQFLCHDTKHSLRVHFLSAALEMGQLFHSERGVGTRRPRGTAAP